MTALLDLDRRMTRAAESGRGIKLTADQLDTLIALGTLDRLAEAKAEFLKEQARCRAIRSQSIDGANTGSPLTSVPMEPREALTSPSGGTTRQLAARAAEAAKRRR